MSAKRGAGKKTTHLLCPECKEKCYLNQFDFTFCEVCDAPVASEHRPPYKLCHTCAEKLNRCEQCGTPLD